MKHKHRWKGNWNEDQNKLLFFPNTYNMWAVSNHPKHCSKGTAISFTPLFLRLNNNYDSSSRTGKQRELQVCTAWNVYTLFSIFHLQSCLPFGTHHNAIRTGWPEFTRSSPIGYPLPFGTILSHFFIMYLFTSLTPCLSHQSQPKLYYIILHFSISKILLFSHFQRCEDLRLHLTHFISVLSNQTTSKSKCCHFFFFIFIISGTHLFHSASIISISKLSFLLVVLNISPCYGISWTYF